MKYFLFLVLIILPSYSIFGEGRISLHRDSKLAIHGSTNLITFSLNQDGEDILNKNLKYKISKIQNKFYSSIKSLRISVGKFKSNNPIAEAEFYKMMEITKYPTLTIELIHFEPSADKPKNKGTAKVNITIKGVCKTYDIELYTVVKNNEISLKGEKELSIREFGIEPPTAMLGLIKVSEWIKINFDLLCEIT